MPETRTPLRAEMDFCPVFDAERSLSGLVGIVGAVIYLAHREDGENDEKGDILQALLILQETLDETACGLHAAIAGGKILGERLS